ncbi:hypothetical protein PR048_031373 [Dryococelus australis]|uniref:Uncharacterized protein n=1 Tax=Dryococelus australis TaxID=614101 RepID=A0ABQ9G952_9NEOP|nr:hypothetical protein PR048_031373 [Dryococelus australis]
MKMGKTQAKMTLAVPPFPFEDLLTLSDAAGSLWARTRCLEPPSLHRKPGLLVECVCVLFMPTPKGGIGASVYVAVLWCALHLIREEDALRMEVTSKQVPSCGEGPVLRVHLECKGRVNRRSPTQSLRPAASSGTIPTCENPGVALPGIKPRSPWSEATSLATKPLRPQILSRRSGTGILSTCTKTALQLYSLSKDRKVCLNGRSLRDDTYKSSRLADVAWKAFPIWRRRATYNDTRNDFRRTPRRWRCTGNRKLPTGMCDGGVLDLVTRGRLKLLEVSEKKQLTNTNRSPPVTVCISSGAHVPGSAMLGLKSLHFAHAKRVSSSGGVPNFSRGLQQLKETERGAMFRRRVWLELDMTAPRDDRACDAQSQQELCHRVDLSIKLWQIRLHARKTPKTPSADSLLCSVLAINIHDLQPVRNSGRGTERVDWLARSKVRLGHKATPIEAKMVPVDVIRPKFTNDWQHNTTANNAGTCKISRDDVYSGFVIQPVQRNYVWSSGTELLNIMYAHDSRGGQARVGSRRKYLGSSDSADNALSEDDARPERSVATRQVLHRQISRKRPAQALTSRQEGCRYSSCQRGYTLIMALPWKELVISARGAFFILISVREYCLSIPGVPCREPSSQTVRLLASHQGEPGSIPGRATPGFPQVGIVPDDAAGRRVFSGSSISPYLIFRCCSIRNSFHPLKTEISGVCKRRRRRDERDEERERERDKPRPADSFSVAFSLDKTAPYHYSLLTIFSAVLEGARISDGQAGRLRRVLQSLMLLAPALGLKPRLHSTLDPVTHISFSHVGFVPDDAADRRIFSGISRFPCPYIPALLHTHLASPSTALNTSLLRAALNTPTQLTKHQSGNNTHEFTSGKPSFYHFYSTHPPSVVYVHPSTYRPLSSTYNEGLRIILGWPRYTPVKLLYRLGSAEPPTHLARLHAEKFYRKVRNHPKPTISSIASYDPGIQHPHRRLLNFLLPFVLPQLLGAVLQSLLQLGYFATQPLGALLAPLQGPRHVLGGLSSVPAVTRIRRLGRRVAARTVSLLASHLGELASIPGWVTPNFREWESYRTIPLVDGFSPGSPVFSHPFIPELPHSHLVSPSSAH